MRAKKLVTLAVPFMLLVGCEVGDKDSTHKTEQTSKAITKTVISEQQYPYYICEQVVEFQFKKDELLLNLGESLKDKAKAKAVLKTSNEIDKILDNMEHIKVPDTYKDIHKSIQEGVTEARKATKLIKDAGKEDKQKIQEATMKGTEFLSGVDGEHWKKQFMSYRRKTKMLIVRHLIRK